MAVEGKGHNEVMSTPSVDVQHSGSTTVHLFGASILMQDGHPVEVPLGGPRELLALLVLSPKNRTSLARISSVMGYQLSIRDVKELNENLMASLAGTGIESAMLGDKLEFKGASGAHAPEVGLHGSIDIDLDRFRTLVVEAMKLTNAPDSKRDLRLAIDQLRGRPLEELSGSYFEQWRRDLNLVRHFANKLAESLETFGDLENFEEQFAVRSNRDHLRSALTSVNYSAPHRLVRAHREAIASQADTKKPAFPAIPISIFLDDGRDHEAVEKALTEFLARQSFEVFGHEPPIIGSWFRRFWARARQETAHLTPARLSAEAERKVRLEVFDKDQAAVDNLVATGMAAVITALQGEENACVRAGAILVLKVDGRLYSTTLFQYQLAWLEREQHQVLLRDPAGLLKALDELGTGEASKAIEESPDAA